MGLRYTGRVDRERIRSILLTIFLSVLSTNAAGQNSLEGQDFWFNFFEKSYNYRDTMMVFINAPLGGKATLTIPASGFDTTLSLSSSDVNRIFIPESFKCNRFDTFTKLAIHVTSTKTITIYSATSNIYMADATPVIPSNAIPMHAEFIVNCPELGLWIDTVTLFGNPESRLRYTSERQYFSIVPHDSHVRVEIIPSAQTGSGRPANVPFTKTLNKGEVFFVNETLRKKSLHGSRIKVLSPGKKISVFFGELCGNTWIPVPHPNPNRNPWDYSACDPYLEVVPPVNTLGKDFTLFPVNVQSGYTEGYTYFIVPSENNTRLIINGKFIKVLNKGDLYHSYIKGENTLCISTSRPVHITEIPKTYSAIPISGPSLQHPSLQYIVPNTKLVKEANVTSFPIADITKHYLSILLHDDGKDSLYIDDKLISPTLIKSAGCCNGFSYYSESISKGNHKIRCSAGFIAYVNGGGDYITYGTFGAANLDRPNLSFSADLLDQCARTFKVKLKPDPDTLKKYRWVFSDGTIDSSKNPIKTINGIDSGNVMLYAFFGDSLGWDSVRHNPVVCYQGPIPQIKLDIDSGSCSQYPRILATLENKDLFDSTLTYLWTNNLGDTSIRDSFQFETHDTGNVQVRLIISNHTGCVDSTSLARIWISRGVEAKAILSDSQPCLGDNHFQFLNQSLVNGKKIQFTWHWGDGEQSSLNQPPLKSYMDTGVYLVMLLARDSSGCTDTFRHSVEVLPSPNVDVKLSDSLLCLTQSLKASSSVSFDTNYLHKWYFGDGDSSTKSYVEKLYSQPGKFNLSYIALNLYGCADTFKSPIQVQKKLPIQLSASDTQACINEEGFMITGKTSSSGFITYKWYFGDGDSAFNNPVFKSYSDTGAYHVWCIAADSFGCSDTAKIWLTVKPHSQIEILTSDTVICSGLDSIDLDIIKVSGPDMQKIKWNLWPDTIPSIKKRFYPGQHIIEAYALNQENCWDSASIELTVNPSPKAHILPLKSDTQCLKRNIFIWESNVAGTDTLKYTWIVNGQWASNSSSISHSYTHIKRDTVILIVQDQNGCSDTSYAHAEVKECKFSITTYNTFTPNGDGINDFFDIPISESSLYKLSIFNRYGTLVFESNHEQLDWDGTLFNKGTKSAEGTYFYHLVYREEGNSLDETNDIYGVIQLIR